MNEGWPHRRTAREKAPSAGGMGGFDGGSLKDAVLVADYMFNQLQAVSQPRLSLIWSTAVVSWPQNPWFEDPTLRISAWL